MKVACGWDHHGRKFRDALHKLLNGMGHEFVNLGASTDEPSDYPGFAFEVAEAVTRGEADRGVLVCGTGIGMSIAANKVPGIRAAVVTDEDTARLSRTHNNANVLCVAEALVESFVFERILRIWLTTDFDRGRHAVRVNKIANREKDLRQGK